MTKKILLYSINFAPELTGIGKYTGELPNLARLCQDSLRGVGAALKVPDGAQRWCCLEDFCFFE